MRLLRVERPGSRPHLGPHLVGVGAHHAGKLAHERLDLRLVANARDQPGCVADRVDARVGAIEVVARYDVAEDEPVQRHPASNARAPLRRPRRSAGRTGHGPRARPRHRSGRRTAGRARGRDPCDLRSPGRRSGARARRSPGSILSPRQRRIAFDLGRRDARMDAITTRHAGRERRDKSKVEAWCASSRAWSAPTPTRCGPRCGPLSGACRGAADRRLVRPSTRGLPPGPAPVGPRPREQEVLDRARSGRARLQYPDSLKAG